MKWVVFSILVSLLFASSSFAAKIDCGKLTKSNIRSCLGSNIPIVERPGINDFLEIRRVINEAKTQYASYDAAKESIKKTQVEVAEKCSGIIARFLPECADAKEMLAKIQREAGVERAKAYLLFNLAIKMTNTAYKLTPPKSTVTAVDRAPLADWAPRFSEAEVLN